jgi:hypothetical protein
LFEVTARVFVLKSQTNDAIAADRDRIKGGIVLNGAPTTLPTDQNPENAYDAVIAPPRGLPAQNAEAGRGGQ